MAKLTSLNKSAMKAEEETGVLSLYLTLGTVLWTNKKKKELRSPFLLVPVKLVLGHGRQPGLVLKKALDGTVLNYCLVQMLWQTFRLSIPALDSWSISSDGVEDAFQAFRAGVKEAKIQDDLIRLESSCALALLSFRKLRMWLDLRDRWKDFMSTSSVVKHLIETPTQSYKQEEQTAAAAKAFESAKVESADVYCPIPYDGSQLEAILSAAKGRSFVLEGPPGTGKSQTITNLLAQALAMRQRVLFVAEKPAALDVVKSRLQAVGIGSFCLDIHSSNSTPNALRQQLRASLDFKATSDEEEYKCVRKTAAALARELQQYTDELDLPNAVGFSLWSAHQACLCWSPDVEPPDEEEPSIIVDRVGNGNGLSGPARNRLEEVEDRCTTLVREARGSGFDDGCPWGFSGLTDPEDVDHGLVERCLKGLTVNGLASLAEVANAGGSLTPRALELVDAFEQTKNVDGIFGRAYWFAAWLRWKALQVREDQETLALAEALLQQTPEARKALKAFQPGWLELCTSLNADEESLARWCGSSTLLSRVEECLPIWKDDAKRQFLQLGCWARFLSELQFLRGLGLKSLAKAVLERGISLDELAGCAPFSIARACRHERLTALKTLREFFGARHNSIVDKFAECIEKERKLLPERLPAKLLEMRALPETNALFHALDAAEDWKRKSGGPSIRELLRTHSAVIGALMPCVLASPDSVALFLEPGEMFDLVVFDEASQITTANAVGAMGRGRAVVVAGDSKQMPPSKSGTTGDEGEDEDVVKDVESILDECRDSRVQQVCLSWHYRSEDESLIAFSNKHYYENRLSSFPAPSGRPELGITWRKVEGQRKVEGKSKKITNPLEAKAIVREVCLRLSDPSERSRSIGVVALNAAQADLIRSLLQNECASDEALSRAMDECKMFVRNLESVQGDERDVIIISVTYVPDPGTKLTHNRLGPLCKAGGERRWNVLITRAKQEVVVFSSMKPEDIKEEKLDENVGARDVRSYLFLARAQPQRRGNGPTWPRGGDGIDRNGGSTGGQGGEGGSSGDGAGSSGSNDGGGDGDEDSTGACVSTDGSVRLHRNEIAETLRKRGYRVKESVGLSSFKIDLAVAHSASPAGIWQVAVLLDGKGYQKRASVRDRDVLPKQVLEGLMKWPRVKRVWLPEWLKEREKVTDEICKLVDSAYRGT